MGETRNNSSMAVGQSKEQKRRGGRVVILDAQRDNKKVHFATLMDICHLKKKSELEPTFQKYKGSVVLRGDIAKDDSGA